MSVSVTRSEGVTVLTVTSYGDRTYSPLLCQLCTLCCCPRLNVLRRLPSPQGYTQSALGALQIMIGVFTTALGLTFFINYYNYIGPMAPEWIIYIPFIIVGISSILSERFSCTCMVVLSVILNLGGAACAIAAIVLYSIEFPRTGYDYYSCKRHKNSYDYWYRRHTTTQPPDQDAYQERCLEGQTLLTVLQRSILILLIILSCMELCVAISSATLNIKALKKRKSEPNGPQEPVPEKTTTDPTL